MVGAEEWSNLYVSGEGRLSWCDKLASTPSVGFWLTPKYKSSALILDAILPFLDKLSDVNSAYFSISRQDAFSVGFNTPDGFNYQIDQSRISVTFQHSVSPKIVSGGPPIMTMLSEPLPYTELLDKLSEKAVEIATLMPDLRHRDILRVGIATVTNVAEDEVPPGIGRLISYFGHPWGGDLQGYNYSVTSVLLKNSYWLDRCIHQITIPDMLIPGERLAYINFDWQRIFSDNRAATHDSLGKNIETAKREALQYFEELAEGGRFE